MSTLQNILAFPPGHEVHYFHHNWSKHIKFLLDQDKTSVGLSNKNEAEFLDIKTTHFVWKLSTCDAKAKEARVSVLASSSQQY